MKIRCIAVDDEPLALEKLSSYISKIPSLELVGACESAAEAAELMEANDVDALFIDINMPDINGIEFVRSLANPPLVVFITAYPEFAVESYKVRAIDYLLKPYDFNDFQRAAANLQKQMKLVGQSSVLDEDKAIYLKVDYRYVRVQLDEIIFIEGMNEYLKVHISSGEPFLIHTTFKNIMGSLPNCFMQVHRSYVVNMRHVKEVERSVILMSDGSHVSISDSNKDAVMNYMQLRSLRH